MPVKKEKKSFLNIDVSLGGVSLVEKAVFAKHLAVMLNAGLVLVDAFEIAVDSANGKFKKVLKKVYTSLEAGNTLADSLSKYPKVFSGLFIDVTRAGEIAGTLPENLENIAGQLDKEHKLVSKVKGAMAYPSVILVAAFFLALGMSYYILPQITPLFTGLKVELPVTTRMVMWFSKVMQNHGGKVILGTIVGISSLVWLAKQPFTHPFTHWVLLKMPIAKRIVVNNNLARFCLTLGTLLRSGIPIDESLQITNRTVSNYYYRRLLLKVAKNIERGSTVSSNLKRREDLFPKLVTSMIHVGEESGKLDETLLYLADFYELEVDNATKTLTTALEPVLLVVIGVVVGVLALSIITPIYEITGSIKR